MAEAEAAGLPAAELAGARSALQTQERREAASAGLARALGCRDVEALQVAIQRATEAGMPASELRDVRARLREAEQQAATRQLEEVGGPKGAAEGDGGPWWEGGRICLSRGGCVQA